MTCRHALLLVSPLILGVLRAIGKGADPEVRARRGAAVGAAAAAGTAAQVAVGDVDLARLDVLQPVLRPTITAAETVCVAQGQDEARSLDTLLFTSAQPPRARAVRIESCAVAGYPGFSSSPSRRHVLMSRLLFAAPI